MKGCSGGLSSTSRALRFEVEDTGPGIPANTLARLFQPFEQGELGQLVGGSGLGLAIARGLVALQGGELKVESQPGLGSRFWFELPLPVTRPRRESPDPRLARPMTRLAPGSRVRALVVDDVAANREILGSMLRLVGSECSVAASGAEAIEIFQVERPDISFLDIRMPGLDGIATLQRLKALAATPIAAGTPKTVRFVAVSASVLEHERCRYLEVGFDDFIGKPFRLERLCACLAELLSVEFERENPELPRTEDQTPVVLPPELVARLESAASAFLISDLKAGCAAIAQLGPSHTALAERLRRCIARYDMNGVLELLAAAPRQASDPPASQSLDPCLTPK